MDIKCNLCGASLNGVPVSEAMAWDKSHSDTCPAEQVGATQQPITQQFNQGVNEIREGGA